MSWHPIILNSFLFILADILPSHLIDSHQQPHPPLPHSLLFDLEKRQFLIQSNARMNKSLTDAFASI